MKLLPNNTNESNSNHLQTDVDGYLRAMIMNGVSGAQHLKENESYLLNQMIDEVVNILANKAEPFKKETDECFNVTQVEIDAMVSNIPTPKSKQSNLIPMVLLLMHTINGIITNRPLVALCNSGSSHCMFNKRALPFGATTFKTQKIKTTTTQGTYDCDEAVVLSNLFLPEFVNGWKITNLSAQLFKSENCPYDVILGRIYGQHWVGHSVFKW